MNTNTRSISRPSVRVILALVLTVLGSGLAEADIVADFIAPAYEPPVQGGGPGEYDSATFDVFLDPANIDWIALSCYPDLRTTLPNLTGIPTIQSTQMFDNIRLTVSVGANTSPMITLDDNDGYNHPIGNQAVFYGYFDSVGRYDGFTASTYGAQPETGELTSFFDTHGAGTYHFYVSFWDKWAGGGVGHLDTYLLRSEIEPQSVPEPSSAMLLAFATVGVCAWRRRKRLPFSTMCR